MGQSNWLEKNYLLKKTNNNIKYSLSEIMNNNEGVFKALQVINFPLPWPQGRISEMIA